MKLILTIVCVMCVVMLAQDRHTKVFTVDSSGILRDTAAFNSWKIQLHRTIDTQYVTVVWDSAGYLKASSVIKIRYGTSNKWFLFADDSIAYYKANKRFSNFRIMEFSQSRTNK